MTPIPFRLALTAAVLFVPPLAEAQTAADDLWQQGRPSWMSAWSPLSRLGDLGAAPLSATTFGAIAPAPRVGLWWTAGLPATIAYELPDEYSEFRFAAAHAAGTYRRVMDPQDVSVVQASALGWRPIAQSGGAAGSFVVDQETSGARPFAATLVPYASDPFIVADTTSPATRRVRARLEGAFGWRVGALGLGIAAGLEEGDHRTRDAGFPHFGRTSTPAVRAGLAWTPFPSLQIGVYGRWTRNAETLSMGPRTTPGMVFRFAGYHDPDSAAVVGPAFSFSRSSRTAYTGGLAAGGHLLSTDWVAWVDRPRRINRHFSALVADPPTDRWEAEGWTWGGALQRWFLDRLLFTGTIRRETLHGDARLADLDGVVFRSSESELTVSSDLRYVPVASPWSVITSYVLVRTHRLRYDFIAEVGTDLVEWTPGLTIAVIRRMGRASVGLGASGVGYSAVGAIPDANALGPVYQSHVAPTMTLAASRARPLRVTASLGYQVGHATTLQLEGDYMSIDGSDTSLPFAPGGTRTSWAFGVRVTTSR